MESTGITSVFLDKCLHMFFTHFNPTFPVLHRPTFVFKDCTPPLLLNAIALGSLFLGPRDAIAKVSRILPASSFTLMGSLQQGEALWRLAHIAVATSVSHTGPRRSRSLTIPVEVANSYDASGSLRCMPWNSTCIDCPTGSILRNALKGTSSLFCF